LLPEDEEGDQSDNGHDGENYQENLFHVLWVLRVSPNSVYAMDAGSVPSSQ
jgi:hypothetical protein